MSASNRFTKIYFIRHGETAWSLTGHHTGRTDLPLTEKGEQEAHELRQWIRPLTFDHVFVSPRKRARQTCEICELAARAMTDPDLAEWDYGDYEGQHSDAIHVERPGWNIFTDGCPGGESCEQITVRADRLIARLCTLSGSVVVFSHGHFGRAFGVRWIGLPLIQARHFLLGTASLSVFANHSDRVDPPVIVQWNLLPAHASAAV
ncbi:MAG: histidine phosphatase family protein [Opitutus sp.]